MKLLALVIALVVALVLVACGGDDETATTDTTTTTTTTEPTTTTTTTTTTPPPEGPTVVRIRVRDGAPVGGIVRETVDQGDRVVLVVTADVTDEVHVHGYNLMRDVAPGSPARIAFRATLPGVAEVELEDRGLQIAELTVRP
jgi:hypothetical protein